VSSSRQTLVATGVAVGLEGVGLTRPKRSYKEIIIRPRKARAVHFMPSKTIIQHRSPQINKVSSQHHVSDLQAKNKELVAVRQFLATLLPLALISSSNLLSCPTVDDGMLLVTIIAGDTLL